MGLESGNYIPELEIANPAGSDSVASGDDHLRLIKRCIKNSFEGFVGDSDTPKAVTATEEQLSGVATLIYTALQQFEGGILLGNNALATANNAAEDDVVDVIGVTSADEVQVGDLNYDMVVRALAEIDTFVAALPVLKAVTRELGSLLIYDRLGSASKVGYRNPRSFSIAGGSALAQNYEGAVVRVTTPGAFNMPSLEQFTAITLINASGGEVTLAESAADLEWLDGSSGATGDRTVNDNSVVQLYWRTATVVELWGNGIS